MADRVTSHSKISIEFSTEVVESLGEDKLTGLVLMSGDVKLPYRVNANGLFVAIGNDPRTALM